MPAPASFPTPAPVREALATFTQLVAPCSVQGCPKPGAAPAAFTVAPAKPCNLMKLQVIEPKADPGGKPGTRAADFLQARQRVRLQSPVKLRTATDTLQITAVSKPQGTRQLDITCHLDAWCGDPAHQLIHVKGPGVDKEFPGTKASVGLFRRHFPTDSGPTPGFWAFINACWQAAAAPAEYEIRSITCGLPTSAKSAPLATLLGRIEVFPADTFELSLKIPALLQPDALSLDLKSDGWKSADDRKKDQLQKDADAYYASEQTFFREAGVTRSEVRKFVADMEKKKSGADDKDFVDKLEIKFRQTDGGRVIEAPIDDIVKLVRCVRDAEYAAKKVGDWISGAQVGPGASIKVDCQFFAGSIDARWQRMEHTDDRVFLGWEAELSIAIVKLEITLAVGWRCAGLADLFVELAGAGTLSIAGSAASKSPDQKVELDAKPSGKLELSGKVKGELMWCVSGETGLECAFETDCDDFHFMRKGKVLSGEIVVKRGAVNRTIAYSSRVYGGTAEKAEIVPADDRFGCFTLGS